jgi:hypothetical protein
MADVDGELVAALTATVAFLERLVRQRAVALLAAVRASRLNSSPNSARAMRPKPDLLRVSWISHTAAARTARPICPARAARPTIARSLNTRDFPRRPATDREARMILTVHDHLLFEVPRGPVPRN